MRRMLKSAILCDSWQNVRDRTKSRPLMHTPRRYNGPYATNLQSAEKYQDQGIRSSNPQNEDAYQDPRVYDLYPKYVNK